ncbi:MAG: 50S ribosomal protein L32 [Kiritimatiellae bacterium]|nr:50S ribosomal protein L32 [Kiritimatiellia bacterium]
MAVPNTKVSHMKLRQRKAAWNSKVPKAATGVCPECGAPKQPHRVCPKCGKYNGKQVIIVDAED